MLQSLLSALSRSLTAQAAASPVGTQTTSSTSSRLSVLVLARLLSALVLFTLCSSLLASLLMTNSPFHPSTLQTASKSAYGSSFYVNYNLILSY